MAHIIIVDGPEKAGKSYVCEVLRREFGVRVRHWGPVSPDDRVYSLPLWVDCLSVEQFVAWDRGWPAEHVYAHLLRRDRRLRDDPWLGEWLHGRACAAKFILLGPSVKELIEKRQDDDLRVDPELERDHYREYGKRFGYTVLENVHTPACALEVAKLMLGTADLRGRPDDPSLIVGPSSARVVVVGEKRGNLHQRITPGAWLPFTSRYTTEFGRWFGDYAFQCAWTNAYEANPRMLDRAEVVVACGDIATRWARYVAGAPRVFSVPHPAWLFRWGKASGLIASIRSQIQNLMLEVFGAQEE